MALGSEETSDNGLRDRQVEAGKFIYEMPLEDAIKLHNEVNLGLAWARIGKEACNEVYMSDSREKDADQLDSVQNALGGMVQFEIADKAIRTSTVYVDLENRIKRIENGLQTNNGWAQMDDQQARAVGAAIRNIMADKFRATTYTSSVTKTDVEAAKNLINSKGLEGVFVGVQNPDEVLERFGEKYMHIKPRAFKRKFVAKLA